VKWGAAWATRSVYGDIMLRVGSSPSARSMSLRLGVAFSSAFVRLHALGRQQGLCRVDDRFDEHGTWMCERLVQDRSAVLWALDAIAAQTEPFGNLHEVDRLQGAFIFWVSMSIAMPPSPAKATTCLAGNASCPRSHKAARKPSRRATLSRHNAAQRERGNSVQQTGVVARVPRDESVESECRDRGRCALAGMGVLGRSAASCSRRRHSTASP
jgi:hypothetical protein